MGALASKALLVTRPSFETSDQMIGTLEQTNFVTYPKLELSDSAPKYFPNDECCPLQKNQMQSVISIKVAARIFLMDQSTPPSIHIRFREAVQKKSGLSDSLSHFSS